MIETVLVSIRKHVIAVVAPVSLILTGFLVVLARVCPTALELRLDGRCFPLSTAALALALAPFVLDWLATRYVLTNQRLIICRSPIWQQSRSLRLDAIDALALELGILGRAFGYGRLIADSAATEGGRLVLDFVPRPQELHDRIAAAIADWRS